MKATHASECVDPAAVVFTVDKKFLPHALFVANQIARLHPARDFDFGIMTMDDLGSHPLIDDLEVKVVRLQEGQVLRSFPHSERISVATYLRFLVPDAFPNYRRILYLDSDLYVRRGDFARLLRADIGDHAIAAARDPVQFRRPHRISKDMKRLNLGDFLYLSAGVLLIDTTRFREKGIAQKALSLVADHPNDMLLFDQTALNAVVQGDFAELPPGWNWLYGFRTLYFTELYDPPILHFAGKRKPWNTFGGEFPVRFGREYAAFLGRHFPEAAREMKALAPPSCNRLAHLRYLINHINGLRRLVPALDEFVGDFDIRIRAPDKHMESKE